MKIAGSNQTKFEPCPEYTGRAVCVDVTELKKVTTQYGEQEKFRIVFEVDLEQHTKIDGKDVTRPWCVWSQGFTPSLHEKAALRKFLRQWFGRDLTDAEITLFDTESLIGRPAFLVVTHQQAKEGTETYANIAAITPHKQGDPLKPSGAFVRQKDRQAQTNGQRGSAGRDSSYRQTETPRAQQQADLPGETGDGPQGDATYLTTKVHVGRFKGTELRELASESIDNLVTHWLPVAKANPRPTADDRRLMAALEWFAAQKAEAAAKAAELAATDDVPY